MFDPEPTPAQIVIYGAMPEFAGRSYEAMVGSDVGRDGMFLEIRDAAGGPVAEVFYSDRTGEMTFTSQSADLPLTALEWIVETARRRLTPST